MSSIMLMGLLAGAIALLVAAAYLYFGVAPQREQEEAMSVRLTAGDAPEVPAMATSGVPRVIQASGPVADTLNRSLWRAGVRGSARPLWTAIAGAAAIVVVVLVAFGALAGFAALLLVVLVGYIALRQMQASYRQKLVRQLPEFLEHVIRALAAGNTLETAFSAAADESEEPIKGLFASIIRQLKLGAPLDEVLSEAADIHQIKDLHVVALSAKINRKYGGSLRRLLKVLINAIHQRERTLSELRALTAETRFSALVLVLIPVAIISFVWFQNPEYYRTAWADTVGRLMLIGTGVLTIMGSFIIYRMMRSTGGEC